MSAQASKWAWRQEGLNLGDRVALLAFAHEADKEGLCEFDEHEIKDRTGMGEVALVSAVASLAKKGLISGPRWEAGKGWLSTKVKLAFSAAERHLASVNGRKVA